MQQNICIRICHYVSIASRVSSVSRNIVQLCTTKGRTASANMVMLYISERTQTNIFHLKTFNYPSTPVSGKYVDPALQKSKFNLKFTNVHKRAKAKMQLTKGFNSMNNKLSKSSLQIHTDTLEIYNLLRNTNISE